MRWALGLGTCPVPLAGIPTHQGNSCSSLGIGEEKDRVHSGEVNTQRNARTEEWVSPCCTVHEDGNKSLSSTPIKLSFPKVAGHCQPFSFIAPLPVQRAGLGLLLGTFYKQYNHRIERVWVEILP